MSNSQDPSADRRLYPNGYMIGVSVLGAVCVCLSIFYFPLQKLDLNLVLLAAITIGLGSKISLPIPRFKSHIAVSDTLIFLTLLLYGGEAAIILAAAEAFVSARRFCNKNITVFFNSGTLAVSTTAVVVLLWSYGFYGENQQQKPNAYVGEFVTTLAVIAVTQFLFNTVLASIYVALKDGSPVWESWKSKFVMTFPTYLVGAIGAGMLVELIHREGFAVMFAAVPVIVFVFLSYRMYLRNAELANLQTDQAREYAKAMRERTHALRDSEERFRRAFDHAPIGIAIVTPFGKWLKTNRAMSRILGYSQKEFKEMTFHSMIFEEDLTEVLGKLSEVQAGTVDGHQMEQRYLHKNGSTVWASWSISTAGNVREGHTNFIFQIQDITERKFAEEKLQYEATHDSLTGLPNRANFMKRLDKALARSAEDTRHKVSVLFIDLDRFKYVNDSLGHQVGDELLKAISGRVNACLRSPDFVARLGGDEFVVLVEGRHQPDKITRIADRIQKKVTTPFMLQGHEVFSSASIGILNASEQHRTAADIIRDADTAMYHAKRAGKARHETFDSGMRDAVCETQKLETDLRRAVQNDELEVYYQPIFSLSGDRLYAMEALARWNHPTLGVIGPDRFIPLAEEIGLMDALGDSMMKLACGHIRAIQQENSGLNDLKLSINLSSRQFKNPDLVERIVAILDETQFPADRLKLEITETVFFQQHELAIEVLHRLREIGIETDIDDFGTGYSNLGYLVRLPISALKIDRSFVTMMSENIANREVIRTVISLAENLGIEVIAEGIENETQRDALRNLGCTYGQGYYYAGPMNASDTEKFLAKTTPNLFQNLPIAEVSEFSTIQ
ncbi:MAG TPA: EAL domain-containing protein [Pyrinomonadaceae bacterium]|nr:EAL domain-containing protein [Pyrinomonadaceae bacterium]